MRGWLCQVNFVNAIQKHDAERCYRVGKNGTLSVPRIFREKTTNQLMAAFLPVIKSSLAGK
jgi:hypothetical protein